MTDTGAGTPLTAKALNAAIDLTSGPGNGTMTRIRPIEEWRRLDRLFRAARSRPATDPAGLDVERLMDAEHRWCVQVEGEWALGHPVESHRKQAEYIAARLSVADGPGPEERP